jgi:CxxC motif-containing protein
MDGNANNSGVGEVEVNPNVNCLDGKRCPRCGSYGPFEIVVSMRILLYDSGSDDAEDGSIEYDENAPAKCNACQYEGKFRAFDVR